MLTRVMCYATTICSTQFVRVGLCVRSFGRGFLPMYESREVSTFLKLDSFEILSNGIPFANSFPLFTPTLSSEFTIHNQHSVANVTQIAAV